MTAGDERRLFERYSLGEINRRELERLIGREVLFGDAFSQLLDYGLPLPRIRSDPDTPGIQLLRRVLQESRHG